jgi:hypothetical protein
MIVEKLEHIDRLKQLGDLLAKPLDRMGFEELLNDMVVRDPKSKILTVV